MEETSPSGENVRTYGTVQRAQVNSAQSEGVPATDRLTVLICEDEEPLRELVRVSLDESYEFVEAADGDTASRLVRKVRPDLVVLDLMLPGRSGLDVLDEIRRSSVLSHIPVLVITASSSPAETVFAAGADRLLRKPFTPAELRETVEELVADR
jgi:DNA-binding response OmpR family regulator